MFAEPENPAWEYQVVHLNVNEVRPAGAPSPGAPTQAESAPQVFSQAYLEQEFPGFYGPRPSPQPPGTPASAGPHPAQQLQSFLNRLGEQGWMLVGVFPIGSLLMLIMRRPLLRPSQPQPPGKSADGPTSAPDSPLLRTILQRLEALEQTHNLEHHNHALPTAEAARALGFGSASPLTTALKHGGAGDGLVVHGGNGMAAVYQGMGVPSGGGRRCRLWRVLPAAQLPGS